MCLIISTKRGALRKLSCIDFTSISSEYQASGYHPARRPRKTFPVFNAPVCEDVDVALSLLKPRHNKVLNSILGFSNRYQVVRPSQATLGIRTGLHRATVNDTLHDLESLGLIGMNYHHMETSEYLAAKNFLDPKIRSKYAHIFRSLFVMPWTFLLVNSGMPLNLKATQYNNKSSSKVNISLVSKVSTTLPLSDQVTFALAMGFHIREIYYPACYKTDGDGNESIRQVICDSKGKSVQESPIRQSIRDIKSLTPTACLTKWGQIELMQFPDAAINYALKAIKMATPMDPFRYFVKVCLIYCKDNGLSASPHLTADLLKRYKRPDSFSMTMPMDTAAEFAKKVVNGFNAYSARQPQSAEKGRIPERNRLVSIDGQPFTMDQLRERKLARETKANEKLVAGGKPPITLGVLHVDPFSLDEVGLKDYLKNISSSFLVPAIKLGLNSPHIEPSKKLMMIKAVSQLPITMSDVISSTQIEALISSISPDHRDTDTLIEANGSGQHTI